jgi:hypothetical protein
MSRVKAVIHERYTAWLEAQRLWDLKLKGVDIYDPKVISKIEEQDRIMKFNERLRKVGKYLPRRLRMRRLPEQPEQKPASEIIQEKLEPFRVQPQYTGRYDMDMVPKANRGRRSRRRIGKFLLSGRQPKIPVPK